MAEKLRKSLELKQFEIVPFPGRKNQHPFLDIEKHLEKVKVKGFRRHLERMKDKKVK